MRLAEPGTEHRFGGSLRQRHQCVRGTGCGHHDLRADHGQHAVDARVRQQRDQGSAQARRGRVADDVHRVAMRPVRWQCRIQRSAGGVRELCQRHALVTRAVGCHHPRPAAVGENGQAVAGRQTPGTKQTRSGKQLAVGLRAHHARAQQGGFEHGIVSHHCASVAHRGACAGRVPPYLEHHNRLGTRRCAQAADEAARLMHALDIEQDRGGRVVIQQVVEDFAKIEIGGRSKRDHAGEADAGRPGPVGQRCANCA